jgi:hypothetical protein
MGRPVQWKQLPEHLRYHILGLLDLFTLCKLFFTAKNTLPRLLVEDYRSRLQLVRPLQHISPSVSFMDIARALYHSVAVPIRSEMHHRVLWSPDLKIQGYCSTLVFFLGRQQQHELGREASLLLAGLPPGRKPSTVETSEQVYPPRNHTQRQRQTLQDQPQCIDDDSDRIKLNSTNDAQSIILILS